MNVKVAQYLLPKLLKGGKGGSSLAQRAAYTLFTTPQSAKTSTSIFSKTASKTCDATKATAKRVLNRVAASDTYTTIKSCVGNTAATVSDAITNSAVFKKTGDFLSGLKNKFIESKAYKAIIKKARNGVALGCKNKVIRDTYGEMYFASKAYQVAKQGVKYDGPLKKIVSNGAGAYSFAKHVGPIPFATGVAGALSVPAPGTAELGLFLGLLAKKGLTKVSNKLKAFADDCFLAFVK